MSIYLTSDLHFNHQNIIVYEPESRPFQTIEEMNEELIKRWNDTVTEEDIIYVLGDFFMGKLDEIEPILSRLKGNIVLVRGNHDTKNRIELYERNGIEVKDIDYITYKGKFFILNHFPIGSEEFGEMVRQDNAEVVYLYGHIHSNAPIDYYNGTYHVGVDTNNLRPISLEEVWQKCQ